MRAITFNPQNDQFQMSDQPIPKIGETDVLVKVDACGLNPVDAKIRYWKSMVPNMTASWVPGLDVSGHVIEVGRKVDNWQVGDQILCHGNMLRPHGGFAEFTVQDAATIIPHPNIQAEVAAATPCAGWTAWRALYDKLRIDEQDSILIAGGSGGVGGFAIQIAAHFKLDKIIATSSVSNHDYVLKLGATHVIDYKTEDIVERVHDITDQQGVCVGLDTVGGENDIFVANSLKFEGQMVEIANTVRPQQYQGAFGRGLSFHQLSLGSGHRHGTSSKAALTSAGERFSSLVEQGAIKVPKLQTVSLEAVGAVLNEMLKQRTVGKIVARI